ncbi:MAG: DUF1566 domain-containing protein [Acinetobacter sp.]|nr:DUF1566 domain-containing protein [Acinetobacter sp.]
MKKFFVWAACLPLALACNLASAIEQSGGNRNAYTYKTDPSLVWYPCRLGSIYNETTKECEGNLVKLTWADTQEYIDKYINAKNVGGYSDWRLPTIYELAQRRNCKSLTPSSLFVSHANPEHKDIGWLEERTGESVLTENGREYKTRIVTIKVPNNDGGYEDVPKRCDRGYGRPRSEAGPNVWSLSKDSNGIWYLERDYYEGDVMKQVKNPAVILNAEIVRSNTKPVLHLSNNKPLLTPEKRHR